MNSPRFRLSALALVACLTLLAPLSASSATFLVTNLNNSGFGSFRQAITDANALAGTDIIVFTVAGTINVTSAMVAVTDPVIINGASAPGYVPCGNPAVALDGGGGSNNGLQFLAGASGSAIAALNVRNFQFNGIQFIGADNCRVAGCYIGTNITGTAAAGNGQNGIQVEVDANNCKFGGATACERNLISGNGVFGVSIVNCSTDTTAGNYIGLNVTGTAALPNGVGGIQVIGSGANHVIGGSVAGEGNVIAGNGSGITGNGVTIDGISGTQFRGNFVGLNAAGTAALGNAENGLAINGAPNTTIGGTGPNDGNVFADHEFHGIVLNGGSNNCIIQGNKSGTNAAGTATLANNDSGVIVINSSGVTIGGNSAAARNLFSGSTTEHGIFLIDADNAIVQGNYVGTDVTGTQPMPNAAGGIRADFGTTGAIIGGSGTGEGNLIAFNNDYGVGVTTASARQNTIRRNSMFCNTGDGIELNGAGNDNYPSPVFSSVTGSGAAGSANPGDIVELFYDSVCTATCQGKDYLGTVTANGLGNWNYLGTIDNNRTLVASATSSSSGNTSEFTCFVVLPVEGLAFGAAPNERGQVRLDWSTTQEVNNLRFVVERSPDGQQFEQIGARAGQGNDPDGHVYTFTDTKPLGSRLYYRLRQVDFNGAIHYSPVVEVVLAAEFIPQVFPLPADGALQVAFPGENQGSVIYTLSDLRGRQLRGGSWTGSGPHLLTVASLAEGIYLLQLRGAAGTFSRKVTVAH
ncbi:MAG: hypothetical protein AAF998_24890 [Bacteroidota bacterium]